MPKISIRKQKQQAPVSNEVLALTSVVRPMLMAALYSTKREVIADAGGYEAVKLRMLGRVHRPSDGDCGVCFEYTVHDALNKRNPEVLERIIDAAKLCKLKFPSQPATSILLGIEKSGSLNLIETARSVLTEESRLLSGEMGQPPKLLQHIDKLVKSWKKQGRTPKLPPSINGLWKADLIIGSQETERWVGTSVKINPGKLQGAKGLRIGIIPANTGKADKVRYDDNKNLVICPLPQDSAFIETFYRAWMIVQAFLAADAEMPNQATLPNPVDRHVASILAERRHLPVLEVIGAIEIFGQRDLLTSDQTEVGLDQLRGESRTDNLIVPIPLGTLRS
jgi:hypothetical protein